MKSIFMMFAFCLGVSTLLTPGAASAAAKNDSKNLQLVISFSQGPQGYIAGKSAEVWKNMLLTLLGLAKEQTGYNVEFFPHFTWTSALGAIEKKEAELIFLLAPDYVLAHNQKAPVKPLITYQVEGNSTFSYCLYAHEKNAISDISGLKGKTLAVEGIDKRAFSKTKYRAVGLQTPVIEHYVAHELIEAAGSELEPEEFFGNILEAPNAEAAMFAVANGEADAAIASERLQILLRRADGRFKKLEPVACTCETPYALVAAREDIDTNAYSTLEAFFLSAHKFGDFDKFKGLSGVDKFVKVEDKAFNPLRELIKKGEKNKWGGLQSQAAEGPEGSKEN